MWSAARSSAARRSSPRMPHDLVVGNDFTYLLIAVLGIAAGLIGVGFQKTLYRGEDAADALWRGRPEWLRPVAGGLLLGCAAAGCCRRCTASATR